MPAGGVVGMDLVNDRDGFANRVSELASVACAFLVEPHDFLLQHRDDPCLDRDQRYSGQTQHRILHENEVNIGAQQPTLIDGRRQYLAHEPAQGFNLAQDRLDDLA